MNTGPSLFLQHPMYMFTSCLRPVYVLFTCFTRPVNVKITTTRDKKRDPHPVYGSVRSNVVKYRCEFTTCLITFESAFNHAVAARLIRASQYTFITMLCKNNKGDGSQLVACFYVSLNLSSGFS